MGIIHGHSGNTRAGSGPYLADASFLGVKALILTDSSDVAISATRKFTALGMEVCWARDAGVTSYYLSRDKFDLLLIDCDGPAAKAERLFADLSSLSGASGPIKIAYSGQPFLQLQDLVVKNRLTGIVPKHASFDVLKELLLEWVKPA